MKTLARYLLTSCLILLTVVTIAQDTTRQRRERLFPGSDSSRQRSDSGSSRRGSSLFADTAALTSSDYQLQIEKSYLVLTNIYNKSELGLTFGEIRSEQADDSTILSVLKDNILNNAKALNLRNLQVFRTLLLNIQSDLKERSVVLDNAEKNLSGLRGNLQTLMADTVLRQLLRDSVLREQFASELKDMREVWRSGTRRLRRSLATVNLLQTNTSSSSITTASLLEKVNNLLSTSASRVFGKEYNYIWEKDTSTLSQRELYSFKKVYQGEKKALQYYFKDSSHKRLLLLLVGLLFFFWIYRNIRILRKHNALTKLERADFEYLPVNYIISAFVVMFCIAPLFDLHAPSAYIESIEFLLLIILTIICWKKWPRKLFFYWLVMIVLYVCFSLNHHTVDPGFWHRIFFILLNILSIIFGLLFLSKMKPYLPLKGFVGFVIILHNILNVLSIFMNITGRLSLAQIFGNAAIFAFMQAIGLAVFSKICMEAILLQMVTSRVKRNVQSAFEFKPVLKSFGRPIFFLVIVLWVIVFSTNLNIYTSLIAGLGDFLQAPRHIGNAYFTIGGILLFFMIIWIAHLLQKYIGYFFGDTGTDDVSQNKGQRSRLLIIKLILLCLGYLLAVAASGVPVDKITIVLGALGVGIGLGLQNIVNNFVSGIILIFDRPFQVGDIVEVDNKSGKVKEIGMRSSTLLTQDGAEVIIPNGDLLSHQIVNWTLTNDQQRLEMDLSVNGSKDMEVVASIIKKAILSSDYVFENREPQILFTKIKEEGFELKAFFWCTHVLKSEEAKSEILIKLHAALKEANLGLEY